MSPNPMASVKEMETYLTKTKWKKCDGGWMNKNKDEFGSAIYPLTHAFRLQLDYEKKGKK